MYINENHNTLVAFTEIYFGKIAIDYNPCVGFSHSSQCSQKNVKEEIN